MTSLTAKTKLLSDAELLFFKTLFKAKKRKHSIAIKVRMADLIEFNQSEWQSYGRRLSGMHCDFVLVDKKTTAIICCIELDDKSHQSKSAYERDAIKSEALHKAGIKLLRVAATRAYKTREIKKAIYKD